MYISITSISDMLTQSGKGFLGKVIFQSQRSVKHFNVSSVLKITTYLIYTIFLILVTRLLALIQAPYLRGPSPHASKSF